MTGTGAQGQGRFSYNAGGMPNQQNQMHTIQKKQQQNSQGVVNLNSMKGFFSARGQGMRSGEKSQQNGEIQKPGNQMHSNRSASGQMNMNNPGQGGMFSPRRQIMSGTQNGAQFVSVNQPASKNKQHSHSMSVNNANNNSNMSNKEPLSANHAQNQNDSEEARNNR